MRASGSFDSLPDDAGTHLLPCTFFPPSRLHPPVESLEKKNPKPCFLWSQDKEAFQPQHLLQRCPPDTQRSHASSPRSPGAVLLRVVGTAPFHDWEEATSSATWHRCEKIQGTGSPAPVYTADWCRELLTPGHLWESSDHVRVAWLWLSPVVNVTKPGGRLAAQGFHNSNGSGKRGTRGSGSRRASPYDTCLSQGQ